MNTDQTELDRYIKSISGYKRISRDREIVLSKIIADNPDCPTRDKAIKELVEANLFLVVDIALKRRNTGLNIMDLIYEGNIALIRIAQKYSGNHASGACFGTLAYIAISNALADVLRDKIIYLPSAFRKFSKKIRDFENKNKREATPKDIAKLLKVKLERAIIIRDGLNVKTSSVETLAVEDGNWEDLYGKKDPTIDRNILRLDLLKFVNTLKPKYKKVIELLYLNEELDFASAGKKLGCTKQFVEIISKRAMREIKAKLMRAWDKEHKTRTIIMHGGNVDKLRRWDNKHLHGALKKEDKVNKKIYKEVIAHYLGEHR
jgi:RNA polymerase sigma factor (sigma-70 family)